MKKNTKVHYSSKSDEWSTPQYVFDQLNDIYGPFDFDAAANFDNTKCLCWHSDSLDLDWSKYPRIWVNPPYSRLKEFLKKGYETSQKGSTVVMLIPSRTDTKAFHDYVLKADQVLLIKGRLKFGDSKTSAPFPSAVVIFKPGNWATKFQGIKFK